ncbi:MAG: family 16 glycosylhydrolase [Vicinamibacterales bacterium]
MTDRLPRVVGSVVLVTLCWTCGGSPTASTPPPDPTSARVLFRDDFDGSSLNANSWLMPEGAGTFLGRTQLRPPSEALQVGNGALRLRLDTYNPTALTPGDSFWGSEIVTRQTFPRGSGLAVTARMRVPTSMPGGLVAALFTYALRGGATRDEIDFELLTNAPSAVLTNVFNAQGFSVAGRPLSVAGVMAGQFNEFEMHWLPDRLRWIVNGQLAREVLDGVPDTPMTIRLNIWAPATDFADAFNATLRPASTSSANQTFNCEVDYVEIRAL